MTRVYVEKWCVYGHYVEGRCIYIGMGRPHRAFDCRKRSAEWFALVEHGHEVEILSWHATKEECLLSEIAQIQQVKPVCNKMHNGWIHDALKKNWTPDSIPLMTDEIKARIGTSQRRSWQSGKRKRPVRANHRIAIVCQDTGELYDTMTAAATHLGVSVAAVSFAIANKRKVGGMTFMRKERPDV